MHADKPSSKALVMPEECIVKLRGFKGLPPMLHAQHTQSGHLRPCNAVWILTATGMRLIFGHEDGPVARVQTGVTSTDGNEESVAEEHVSIVRDLKDLYIGCYVENFASKWES